MKAIIGIIVFLLISAGILIAGLNPTQNILTCNKENNCCKEDSDCSYIWFTGGCNTPEYVTKVQKENEKRGINQGEAPYRENVTCTCESNKCLEHY